MMARHRLAGWLCSSAAATLAATSDADAGAFAIRQQSSYGHGSSFAGIAAGGSLSSMFWNPATLTDVQGLELEASASVVIGDAKVKTDPVPGLSPGTDEGNVFEPAFIPSGYGAYRLNDRVVLGVAVNSPYGLVTEYNDNSILNQTGVAGKSEIFSIDVNPALAVEVTDWLAFAIGPQIQYFDARLTRQLVPGLGISTLKGDDVGFGFTAGIRVTPVEGTDIGLGYRSAIEHKLDGKLESPAGTFNVDYDGINLPEIVTLGVRQQVTERFRVMAGAEWANWSRFGTVDVEGAPGPVDLQFDYEDGWFFSLGGEFDVTSWASVRSGVGYELSPIDNNARNYRLPYNDVLSLSLGATFRPNERLAFDLGYSYASVEDMQIRAANDGGPTSNGPFSGHADDSAHYISAAIKLRL
jgi:long-chain fatty acid transport protein